MGMEIARGCTSTYVEAIEWRCQYAERCTIRIHDKHIIHLDVFNAFRIEAEAAK